MSMRDLINGEAELDDEENDDSFDEDTGEARPSKQRDPDLDDSSEEEDDDDEEAARAVCANSQSCLSYRVLQCLY